MSEINQPVNNLSFLCQINSFNQDRKMNTINKYFYFF